MAETIIITGASRGIGKAVALELARRDTNIVINCVHHIEQLEKVRDCITANGGTCEIFPGDVSDYNTVKELFTFALNRFGQIDILINNAGISYVGLFQNTSPKEWNHIINVNLNSVYNCCHFAVTDMLKRHAGRIINISSVWGLYGASCETAYSASKGGINAFTKALAKELAPSHIAVNAIACGAIDTEMNRFLSEEELEALLMEIPAGRMGRPDEVASLVLDLCTENEYLTGQVIQLDGGWI